MSRKPDGDGRQQDFFGVPQAGPPEPKPPPAKSPTPRPPRVRTAKPPDTPAPPAPVPAPVVVVQEEEPAGRSLHDRIARLSPAEVRDLTAILTDDALAQLTLATIRQLKRRLAREGRGGGKGPRSSLGRAAQQLVAELGEQGGDDEFLD